MFKHLFALIDIAISCHTTCIAATYVIKLKFSTSAMMNNRNILNFSLNSSKLSTNDPNGFHPYVVIG